MRKKKIIVTVVLCSLIIMYFGSYIVNEAQNTTKQYVVIYSNGAGNNVETYNITSSEAAKMRLDSNVSVVEEDGYVYGSDNNNINSNNKGEKTKDFFQKNKHTKTVERRLSKNSDTEWNIQAIKADNVDTELTSNQSAVSGPAVSVVTGSKVKVAIIDSGIDYTSDIDVYLRKNFIPGEDAISIIYEDITGHGTSIAGIIAAKDNERGIIGINPNVELYSARVLDSNLIAPISRVVEAIYWAIDNKVNIINMSYGTATDSEALKRAIQDAYNEDILIVAAAGNNGEIEYPAAYDEVIAVGSVNSKGERSDSSATGEDLELMAPGEQILSTGGFGGVTVASGTSMASPHVAAVASVLWQRDLNCSSDFIRTLLDLSANKYGDDTEYGYGLVDLKYALEQYDELKSIYDNNNNSLNVSAIEDAKENGLLQENEEDVIIFDDVTYVEGSWLSDDHKELAGEKSYVSGNTLSTNGLTIVKLGAVVSDSEIPGFTAYPQFHGFMSKQVGKTYKSNYMASYIYLTNKAVGLYNNTEPTVPSYLSDNDKTGIDTYLTTSGFNGKTWTELLDGNTVNTTNIALFVYGIALHSVTDLYAHCTYNTDGSYIRHALGADINTYIPNRYDCARVMAQILIAHIKRFESGDISDFYTVANETFDWTFYVGRYSKYAQAVDASYYTAHREVFDWMNIDK